MTATAGNPKSRRRWLRFSLRTLFVVLTVFAIWLAVLSYDLWLGVIYVLILLLLTPSYQAFHAQGAAMRVFWIGFGVCGTSYLLLSLAYLNLPTMTLTAHLYSWICPSFPHVEFSDSSYVVPAAPIQEHQVEYMIEYLPPLMYIGHCVWAMIVGLVGGLLVASWRHRGENCSS